MIRGRLLGRGGGEGSAGTAGTRLKGARCRGQPGSGWVLVSVPWSSPWGSHHPGPLNQQLYSLLCVSEQATRLVSIPQVWGRAAKHCLSAGFPRSLFPWPSTTSCEASRRGRAGGGAMPAAWLSNENRLLTQTRMSRNLNFPRGAHERGSQAPALPDSPLRNTRSWMSLRMSLLINAALPTLPARCRAGTDTGG